VNLAAARREPRGLSIVTIDVVPDQNSLIVEWQEKHQYTFPVLIGASLEYLQKE
jgi:hypothetical protein